MNNSDEVVREVRLGYRGRSLAFAILAVALILGGLGGPATARAEGGCPAGMAADMTSMLDRIGSMPEGTWWRANENVYSDVWTPVELRTIHAGGETEPAAIVRAWSSFAWDCRRGDLLLYGGGHANYSGNDTYRWRTSTRRWERMSLPSEIRQDDFGNYTAIDGPMAAPSSAHTYDNNVYLPVADRLLAFGGAAYNNGGPFMLQTSATTQRATGPYLFDPSRANADQVGGTTGSHVQRVAPHPEVTGGQMWANRDIYGFLQGELPIYFPSATTAYTTVNGADVVFLNAAPGPSTRRALYKYVVSNVALPATDTIEKVGSYWEDYTGDGAGTYDPDKNLYVRTATSPNSIGTFTYWNLNSAGPDNHNVVFNPIDSTGSFVMNRQFGIDYDPVRKQYVLWGGGDDVWILKAPATIGRTGWTISRATVQNASAPVFVDEYGGGVLGKWKYVAELDAFVGLEGTQTGNVWIYKPVGWRRPGTTPPVPPPTLTLTASPTDVVSGQSSTLSWSSTDATSCVASGSWTGARAASGTASTGVLSTDVTYVLTCSGAGGNVTRTASVTVAPPPPVPTVTLAASPATIVSGQASTLTWSSTDAANCTASGAWSGSRAISGSVSTGALNADATFALTCIGDGGTASDTAVVVVTPATPAPTISLVANPASIASGQGTTLTWSTTNANSCVASGSWSGTRAASGSASSGALSANATFVLTCIGDGGSASDAAVVAVAPALAAPTISLVANPSAIVSGQATTLTWSSANTTSCTASGAWSGSRATSGSGSTGTLSSDSTFVLTCAGGGGTVNDTATVTVAPLPAAPALSLSANPVSVTIGQSSTLTWSSTNASSCTASGAWSGAREVSGTASTGALNTDTTFILTCVGPGGSVAQSVAVSAVAVAPPTVSITASPTAVEVNGTAQLTWSTTGATDCTASGGWNGSKPANGSASVSGIAAQSTFSLACNGPGGTATSDVTVSVRQTSGSSSSGGGGATSALTLMMLGFGLLRRRLVSVAQA